MIMKFNYTSLGSLLVATLKEIFDIGHDPCGLLLFPPLGCLQVNVHCIRSDSDIQFLR